MVYCDGAGQMVDGIASRRDVRQTYKVRKPKSVFVKIDGYCTMQAEVRDVCDGEWKIT
jgi:hypothetical protein